MGTSSAVRAFADDGGAVRTVSRWFPEDRAAFAVGLSRRFSSSDGAVHHCMIGPVLSAKAAALMARGLMARDPLDDNRVRPVSEADRCPDQSVIDGETVDLRDRVDARVRSFEPDFCRIESKLRVTGTGEQLPPPGGPQPGTIWHPRYASALNRVDRDCIQSRPRSEDRAPPLGARRRVAGRSRPGHRHSADGCDRCCPPGPAGRHLVIRKALRWL